MLWLTLSKKEPFQESIFAFGREAKKGGSTIIYKLSDDIYIKGELSQILNMCKSRHTDGIGSQNSLFASWFEINKKAFTPTLKESQGILRPIILSVHIGRSYIFWGIVRFIVNILYAALSSLWENTAVK